MNSAAWRNPDKGMHSNTGNVMSGSAAPTADTPRTLASGKGPLAPLLLVNFIGTLAYSIVLPFLVFLVTRLGGNALIYGLIGATYPLFQFVGAPLMGLWSDRLGRKRVLLLSQGGTFIAWLVFCGAQLLPPTVLASVHSAWFGDFRVTPPLLMLVVSRALDGLAGGDVSVANAYVADISTDADRSRNFGRMGIAANLGLIAGPPWRLDWGRRTSALSCPCCLRRCCPGLPSCSWPSACPNRSRAGSHRPPTAAGPRALSAKNRWTVSVLPTPQCTARGEPWGCQASDSWWCSAS